MSGREKIIKPTKEEIYELYITQNKERKQIGAIYDRSLRTIAQWLNSYNLKKDPLLGNPFNNKEWQKQKAILRQEKTGYAYNTQNPAWHNKNRDNNEKKTGLRYYVQTEEFKIKSKATLKNKYGVEHQMKIPEIQRKTMRGNTKHSKKEFEWLKLNGVDVNKGNNIFYIDIDGKKYYPDGYSNNIIYEFCGDWWHGNPRIYPHTKYKRAQESYYKTLNKFNKCVEQGYKVIYCWESDFDKNKHIQRIFNGVIEY